MGGARMKCEAPPAALVGFGIRASQERQTKILTRVCMGLGTVLPDVIRGSSLGLHD